MSTTEIVEWFIRKAGKKEYRLDKSIAPRDIAFISMGKLVCFLRGYFLRIRMHKCGGLLFLGRRCKIKYPRKISVGRTVTIEDYVELNALSIHGITMGNNVTIKRNTIIECTGVIRSLGEGLWIGNNVGIAQNCFIQVRGPVKIGNNVMLGPNVSLFSEDHVFKNTDQLLVEQGEVRRGITIEDDVWVGAGSTILDGVTVGSGSVIGAGAVVTKSVPPYSIAVGVPARVIKSRLVLKKNRR